MKDTVAILNIGQGFYYITYGEPEVIYEKALKKAKKLERLLERKVKSE